jgi:hypothetical protein
MRNAGQPVYADGILRRPSNGPSRNTFLALGAAAALLLVGAMMVSRHSAGEGIPVVASDPSPVRVKPENPGGLRPDELGDRMFAGDDYMDKVHLAPPPEAPKTTGW